MDRTGLESYLRDRPRRLALHLEVRAAYEVSIWDCTLYEPR